jgi:hypothetical protein
MKRYTGSTRSQTSTWTLQRRSEHLLLLLVLSPFALCCCCCAQAKKSIMRQAQQTRDSFNVQPYG